MNETAPALRIGAATITRIFETAFTLPPSVLLPAWHDSHGANLAQHLSPATLDLPGNRVTLQTRLWVVEIDGLTIVIDTGIGNGKSRAFSALYDRLDNPVLARLAAAGFDRQRVDYVFSTHLHVDHVGWNTHYEDGRWVPVFPNATYVYGKREREYFASPAGTPRRMVFDDSVLR
jgi:glyoxylase-like metal-dependent hydrolase (beta-lactamase superfamily II)